MKTIRIHQRAGSVLLPVVVATIALGAWALAWEWRNAQPHAVKHATDGGPRHHAKQPAGTTAGLAR